MDASGCRWRAPLPMSRLLFPIQVVLLCCSPLLTWAQEPPDAEALFARGIELHQAGDILGAIEAYKAALAVDPARVDARSNLGAAYARLGRYADAATQYQLALEKEPTQNQVRFNLALAFYKSEDIAAAAPELKRVVDADPQNRNAVLLLADCWSQMGHDGEVVSLLSPREAEFADDRLFAYLLGTALIHRSEVQRGQAMIDRLFRDGETAEGHVLLAVAHMRALDHKAALAEAERAVELNPKLPTVQGLYGVALMNTGRRPEALDAFAKELQENPNNFESNLFRGLILKDAGRLDEAYDDLKRALRLRPQDVRVLYGLGSLHLAAGRLEEAEKALLAVVERAPDYRQAHVLLATVYYRTKRPELGNKERQLMEKLKEHEQEQEPGAQPDLGPGYKGETAAGSSATGAAPADEKRP
jgi:tetratricopeptide (TPR) repeat protein